MRVLKSVNDNWICCVLCGGWAQSDRICWLSCLWIGIMGKIGWEQWTQWRGPHLIGGVNTSQQALVNNYKQYLSLSALFHQRHPFKRNFIPSKYVYKCCWVYFFFWVNSSRCLNLIHPSPNYSESLTSNLLLNIISHSLRSSSHNKIFKHLK